MYFHLFFNQLRIFRDFCAWNWVRHDLVVELLSQPRIHFDHFVLFLNKRIVQHVEKDHFLINDVFTETNKRRDVDERN